MIAKRFRIAFSFAGEKRDYVAQVASILGKRFGEAVILYDKYHKAEFSRSDLAFYLPDLYEKEADLVVVVFCPDYDKKEWCGLEWNAIYGLLKARKAGEVMLTRFERVEGKGLHGLAGYTDLDDQTPDQAASLILERLALNEGQPKDHYIAGTAGGSERPRTSIPNNLPRLQYFFGREAELKKIADALAPEVRGWGALIDGPGGIGKTALAILAAESVPSERFRRIIFLSSPGSPARSGCSAPLSRPTAAGLLSRARPAKPDSAFTIYGCARDWCRPYLCSIATTNRRRPRQRDGAPYRAPRTRHCRPNTVTA